MLESDTTAVESSTVPDGDLLTTEQALTQTAITVAAACAFCGGVLATRGIDDASAWFAAYVLEESLSIDNLFVFSLIFDYFQTPAYAQPRVLKYGLIVAVVLRLSFILAGLAVVERFKGVLLVFSGILLYSAYGLLTEGEEEEEDLANNPIVKLTKQYLPSTDQYVGDSFFTQGADGAKLATPLLLALVCVEVSDVIFAVDSIPAVFGVTTDPFIAFTSNAFALLGLRALYTVISEAVDNFKYLQPAIAVSRRAARMSSSPFCCPAPALLPAAPRSESSPPSRLALASSLTSPPLSCSCQVVLGFIGVKLIGSFAGYEVPTESSLLLVLGVLGTGVGLSVLEASADAEEVAEKAKKGE